MKVLRAVSRAHLTFGMCSYIQDQEKGNAAKRMAEIDETLEKLVAVAKKKGFIDPECTVQSLKEEAAKKKSEDDQGDAVGLMTAMKQSLDKQTSAVRLPNLSAPGCATDCGSFGCAGVCTSSRRRWQQLPEH